MVTRSRWWLLTVLALSLLLVLAACGGKDDDNKSDDTPAPGQEEPGGDDNGQAPGDDEEVTLRFATWLVMPDQATFKAIGDAFEEKYPNVTIEWLHSPDGEPMTDFINQQLAANNPVDVFWQNSFYGMIEYAENLTPYMENDPEWQAYDFIPGINEPFTVNGQQYAVSRGNDTFLIFYNKEMLNELGLEPPANDWTWDDFVEYAKAATNPQENKIGVEGSPFWFEFVAPTLPVANGHAPNVNMMNEDLTKFIADDPNVMEDLDFFLDLMQREGVMLNHARRGELGFEGDWITGNSLFMVHVSPAIAIFNDQLNYEWDVAPFPAGTEKQVGMSFNNPMFMSRASKNKDWAWEFMKFWAASVEGQKLLIDAGGTLPNTNNPEIVEHFNNAALYEGLNTDALRYAAEIGQTDTKIIMPAGNRLGEIIRDWVNKSHQEEVSAFDYFPAVVDSFNDELTRAYEAAAENFQ